MKAFFVGLISLMAVSVLALIGILLYPLVMAFGFFLEIVLVFVFMLFSIWLLGKFIIFIWGKIFKKEIKK